MKLNNVKLFLNLILGFSATTLMFQNCSPQLKALQQAPQQLNALVAPSLTFAPQDTFSTSSVNINFDVKGDASTILCSLNGAQSFDCQSKAVILNDLNDGDYTLSVMLDNQDASLTYQKSFFYTYYKVFRVDRKAPVITVTSTPPSISTMNTATFVFSVTDNLSGVAAIECSLDNSVFQLCKSPLSYTSLAVGTHNFKLRAKDVAGNLSSTYSYSWSIQSGALPSVSITSAPLSLSNITTAAISFQGVNSVSYQCSLDSQAFALCQSPANYSSLGAGSHTFKVRSVSASGSISTEAAASWIIDLTAPTNLSIMPNIGSNLTNLNSISANLSAFDANGIAGYRCALDATAFSNCTSPVSYSGLIDGIHSLKVIATDNAGNVSQEQQYSWTIDSIKPSIVFTKTPSVTSTLTVDTISFAATDSGSGINLTKCSLDNAPFTDCTSPVALMINIGSHNFKVQASDKAGNPSDIMSYSWTVSTAVGTAPLTKIGWIPCAVEGERCDFTGTKNVLYGISPESLHIKKLVSNGTVCNSTNLGSLNTSGYYEPRRCWYEGEVTVPTPTTTITGPSIDINKIPSAAAGSTLFKVYNVPQEFILANNPNWVPPPGGGEFRTSCDFSHMNFDDPIVFPGQPGRAHLHAFFGNTKANAYSTAFSLLNEGTSTCRGGIANRSAYWVPAMIDTKDGSPVRPVSSGFYYKRGVNSNITISPFPPGLRMVAGNAKANSSSTSNRARYKCIGINGSTANYGYTNSIPHCKFNEELIMEVFFPQCWDGVNLDSPDHISHMANDINGVCPASHPVAMPSITLNVTYIPTDDNQTARWRLSSDNYDPSLPAGYSGHGDWFHGWNQDIMKTFVNFCNNKSVDCHSHLLGDGRYID